jgi:hypothetical protein
MPDQVLATSPLPSNFTPHNAGLTHEDILMHRQNTLEQETVRESKKVHSWWARHIFEIQEKFFAFLAFPRFKIGQIFVQIFPHRLSLETFSWQLL